jgi:nucleoside-diphosphate-sugar epimerase
VSLQAQFDLAFYGSYFALLNRADIEDLKAVTGYIPKVKINEGIQEFVNWYKAYFKK